MVEWFGTTLYGSASPIADMMKPGYHEPSGDLSMEQRTRNYSPNTTVLDCYLERADGYSYGSQERLQKQRLKGLFKIVGPTDMYKYPGVASMDYGWFLSDPDLKNETWYRPAATFYKPKTEITKFLEFALALDKFFKF